MKLSIFLSAAMLLASSVYADEFADISVSAIRASAVSVPAPKPVAGAEAMTALDNQYLCYNGNCAITTSVTNVCSDGKHFNTKKKQNKGMGSDEYKDESLNKWAEYQRNTGASADWRDPNHQDITATGEVDAIQVAYVVVPRNHSELLRKATKVCVVATGKCINAEVREIGPAFGELSVGALMQLGLNAHPASGQYNGQISYIFSN